MQNLFTLCVYRIALFVFTLTLIWASAFGQDQPGQAESKPQDRTFRGGLAPVKDQEPPRPVRNNAAQPGEEVVTLRYFKIKKTVRHGGNGPDWEKCKAALDLRQSLTISSNVIFMKGQTAAGGPYFMPGLDESYEKKAPK